MRMKAAPAVPKDTMLATSSAMIRRERVPSPSRTILPTLFLASFRLKKCILHCWMKAIPLRSVTFLSLSPLYFRPTRFVFKVFGPALCPLEGGCLCHYLFTGTLYTCTFTQSWMEQFKTTTATKTAIYQTSPIKGAGIWTALCTASPRDLFFNGLINPINCNSAGACENLAATSSSNCPRSGWVTSSVYR